MDSSSNSLWINKCKDQNGSPRSIQYPLPQPTPNSPMKAKPYLSYEDVKVQNKKKRFNYKLDSERFKPPSSSSSSSSDLSFMVKHYPASPMSSIEEGEIVETGIRLAPWAIPREIKKPVDNTGNSDLFENLTFITDGDYNQTIKGDATASTSTMDNLLVQPKEFIISNEDTIMGNLLVQPEDSTVWIEDIVMDSLLMDNSKDLTIPIQQNSIMDNSLSDYGDSTSAIQEDQTMENLSDNPNNVAVLVQQDESMDMDNLDSTDAVNQEESMDNSLADYKDPSFSIQQDKVMENLNANPTNLAVLVQQKESMGNSLADPEHPTFEIQEDEIIDSFPKPNNVAVFVQPNAIMENDFVTLDSLENADYFKGTGFEQVCLFDMDSQRVIEWPNPLTESEKNGAFPENSGIFAETKEILAAEENNEIQQNDVPPPSPPIEIPDYQKHKFLYQLLEYFPNIEEYPELARILQAIIGKADNNSSRWVETRVPVLTTSNSVETSEGELNEFKCWFLLKCGCGSKYADLQPVELIKSEQGDDVVKYLKITESTVDAVKNIRELRMKPIDNIEQVHPPSPVHPSTLQHPTSQVYSQEFNDICAGLDSESVEIFKEYDAHSDVAKSSTSSTGPPVLSPAHSTSSMDTPSTGPPVLSPAHSTSSMDAPPFSPITSESSMSSTLTTPLYNIANFFAALALSIAHMRPINASKMTLDHFFYKAKAIARATEFDLNRLPENWISRMGEQQNFARLNIPHLQIPGTEVKNFRENALELYYRKLYSLYYH